jgi:hypothetical protein
MEKGLSIVDRIKALTEAAWKKSETSWYEGVDIDAYELLEEASKALQEIKLKYGCLETAIYATCPSGSREYIFEEQEKRINASLTK